MEQLNSKIDGFSVQLLLLLFTLAQNSRDLYAVIILLMYSCWVDTHPISVKCVAKKA